MPSQLNELFSRVSYADLKMRIQLKSEEKLADTMQAYETLCIVISAALGGKQKTEEVRPAPKNAGELEAAMRRAFGQ